MTTPLRWAVVGTGMVSHGFVQDLQSVPGAEIVVVHSRTTAAATTFGERYSIAATTTDFEAVLGDESVDVVYLATPFATHHALAKAALTAGKHVLVEKPIAMNAAEAEDLFQTAATQQRFFMEALWTKFNTGFQHLRAAIEAGDIGELRNMRCGFGAPFPSDGSKWDVARSGGALLDQAIYAVTLAHVLFGRPDSITASGLVRPDGLDITENFTLNYADGRFVQASASIQDFIEPSATIGGTRGWINGLLPFWVPSGFAINTPTLQGLTPPVERRYPLEGNGYTPMIRAVSDGIRSELLQLPEHTPEDSIAVMRTLDEIRGLITT